MFRHFDNLTLPFDAPEKLARADAAHEGPRLRVLIVDDNEPAADALTKLLNKIGMHASARYSGADVLASERLREYDLFLLDIGMPQMDGYELVAMLRASGIQAPIVALTGYGLADDKAKAAAAGFTAHLTKPVGLAEIRALFHELTRATIA